MSKLQIQTFLYSLLHTCAPPSCRTPKRMDVILFYNIHIKQCIHNLQLMRVWCGDDFMFKEGDCYHLNMTMY